MLVLGQAINYCLVYLNYQNIMSYSNLVKGLFLFPLMLFAYNLNSQVPCECTNCPVAIEDNGTFEAYLDVIIDGPNDLGSCPLQEVCFTINHTWVGDLSLSLVSPSGLNYLIMADDNNGTGGCGTSSDNIDICVTTNAIYGGQNPITNNGPYTCNGGNPCLTGLWTMPCGGVTDPFAGAMEAPNCDLDDFNVPGNPVNGTWTLVINDICGSDTGDLVNWSMQFACPADCSTCEPEGGVLNMVDVEECQGNPGLFLNVVPTQNPVPNPAEYGYAFVISDPSTGLITAIQPTLNFVGSQPGTYQVCGLSYAFTDFGIATSFVGTSYQAFVDALLSTTAPFCGDPSEDCFDVIIHENPAPTIVNDSLCIGDCYDIGPFTYCSPGFYMVPFTSIDGCDSIVHLTLTPLEINFTTEIFAVCEGDTYNYNGTEFPEGQHEIVLLNQNGCDSIISIIILTNEMFTEIVPPATTVLDCNITSIVLEGIGHQDGIFDWYDMGWNYIQSGDTTSVYEAGCYYLVETNTLLGVACMDTVDICITDDFPQVPLPSISGQTLLCVGDTVTYTSTTDSSYVGYTWTLPPNVDILSGGQDSSYVEVVWNSIFTGDICIVAASDCGSSDEVCLDIDFEFVVDPPVISGPTLVCPDDISVYNAFVDAALDYNWTVTGGTILSGQNSSQVEVAWDATGGTLCANGISYCGVGPEFCVQIDMDTIPTQADIIGPSIVCANDSVIYNLTVDGNTDSIYWEIPSCANLISGQNSTSVEIMWPDGCPGGDVCAYTFNSCGEGVSSCFPVQVIPIPVVSPIVGPGVVCPGVYSYSQAPVAGAVNYQWSVSSGTITIGQTTNEVDLELSNAGMVEICVEITTDCTVLVANCMEVEVLDLVGTPVITGDTVVCIGGSGMYQIPAVSNAIDYEWSSDCGIISAGQGSTSISIDWANCANGGEVCVQAIGICDTSALICIDIQDQDIPVLDTIIGPAVSCLSMVDTFCANVVDADSYTWTITGGAITSGQNSDCAIVAWTQDGVNQVCLQAANDCGLTPIHCMDIIIGDVPPAGTILGATQTCIDEGQTYEIGNLDTIGIMDYIWTVSSGGIIDAGQGSNELQVSWTNNGPVEICLEAVNSCGNGPSFCTTVDVIDLPDVNAGLDDMVCGSSYDLIGSSTFGALYWNVLSGPGTATFDNISSANTTVSVGELGVYTFELVANEQGCISSDTVSIEFVEEPQVGLITAPLCDNVGATYSFQVEMSAGMAPFEVTGWTGTWIGNVFTTDPIPTGVAYSIGISDANGCGPVLIEGSYTCPCTTEAGTLDANPVQLCRDDSTMISTAGGMILDGNDSYSYLLLNTIPSGSIDGNSIVYETDNGVVFYQTGMAFETDYYLVLVASNTLSGTVDINDPCLSISNAVPVRFTDLPTVGFSNDDQAICSGDVTSVELSIQHVNCVDIELSDGLGGVISQSCVSDGHVINLPFYSLGVYTVEILSIEGEEGCVGNAGATHVITVHDTPTLVVQPEAEVCNSTESGNTTTIDLSQWIVNSSGDVVWENIDNCVFAGTLPNIDLNNTTPGIYQFAVHSNSAIAPCEDVTEIISLTVNDCTCPDLSVNLPDALCNSEAMLDLADYLIDNTVSVEWSLALIPPIGSYVNPSLIGSTLDLSGSAPGYYEVELEYIQTAPAGCQLTNSLSIELVGQLDAGISPSLYAICLDENESLNLNNMIANPDPGGVWFETSIDVSDGGFDPGSGTFNTFNEQAGLYSFEYLVSSGAPCLDDTARVEVLINALPEANILGFDTISCVNTSVELSTIDGGNLGFQWAEQSNLNIILSDSVQLNIEDAGTYVLEVIDLETGCINDNEIKIDAFIDVPIPAVTVVDVDCHGFTDGQIIVDTISGGFEPYLISFDGGAFDDAYQMINLPPGEHTVEVQDAFGCTSVATLQIDEPAPLELFLNADYSSFEQNELGIGDSVYIAGYINTDVDSLDSINWTPSDFVSCDTCLSTWITPDQSVLYTVEFVSGNCTAYETVQILVRKNYDVFVPNIASFNGNGVNDVLMVQGGDKIAEVIQFKIYDRWGACVFTQEHFPVNDPSYGWDGTFDGQLVTSGTYVYSIEVAFIDGHVIQLAGDITVTK